MNSTTFDKLQEQYLNRLPDRLTEIQRAIDNKDLPSLGTHFHKFKGNGQTYGFPIITEVGRILDQHYKKNSPKFLELCAVALRLLQTISPLLAQKAVVQSHSYPDFKILEESLSELLKG